MVCQNEEFQHWLSYLILPAYVIELVKNLKESKKEFRFVDFTVHKKEDVQDLKFRGFWLNQSIQKPFKEVDNLYFGTFILKSDVLFQLVHQMLC